MSTSGQGFRRFVESWSLTNTLVAGCGISASGIGLGELWLLFKIKCASCWPLVGYCHTDATLWGALLMGSGALHAPRMNVFALNKGNPAVFGTPANFCHLCCQLAMPAGLASWHFVLVSSVSLCLLLLL